MPDFLQIDQVRSNTIKYFQIEDLDKLGYFQMLTGRSALNRLLEVLSKEEKAEVPEARSWLCRSLQGYQKASLKDGDLESEEEHLGRTTKKETRQPMLYCRRDGELGNVSVLWFKDKYAGYGHPRKQGQL